MHRSFLRRAPWLAIAIGLACAPLPIIAQAPPIPAAGDDPAETLARDLKTLAEAPRDLEALRGAGEAALALDDANAAIGFFARAQEVAPNDGRVKAGLGAGLVQLKQPRQALDYFAKAVKLGLAEADVAGDRGLAYDLLGDPKRAQKDYALALRAGAADETRRRMALSLGASGDRAGALAALDPLIQKRDAAAWRDRAFVLAMTGDVPGAESVAMAMLPASGAGLKPFLERLATLDAAGKARAVHFGEMPAAGKSYSAAELASVGPKPEFNTPPAAVARRMTAAPKPSAPPAQIALTTPTVSPAAEPRAAAPDAAPRARARPAAAIAVATAPASAIGQTVTARAAVPAGRPSTMPIGSTEPPVRTAAATPAPISGPPSDLARPARPAPAIATLNLPAPTLATAPPLVQLVIGPPHERAAAPAAPGAPAKPVRLALADDAGEAARSPSKKPASDDAPKPARSRATADDRAPKTATADDDRPAAGSKRGAAAKAKASSTKPNGSDDEDTKPARGTKAKHLAGDDAEAPDAKSKRASTDDGDDSKTARGSSKSRRTADDDADGKSTKSRSAKPAADDDRPSRATSKAKQAAKDDDDDRSTKSKHAKAEEASAKASSRKAPARYWVQVAGGANKDDLPKAWSQLRKSSDAYKGLNAYSTPLRFTNRLLVGPFKSEDEAQGAINRLTHAGKSAFLFQSDKGQAVDKLEEK